MTTATLAPPSQTTVECPECAGHVPAEIGLMLHELLPCPSCGAELEVIELDPLTVDLAPEIEEDWGE